METSTILLKQPVVLRLPSDHETPTLFSHCVLTWEQTSLLVTAKSSGNEASIPALQNSTWLKECLIKSAIQKIYLDPTMPEATIRAWADMGKVTSKQVYLRVPTTSELPQMKSPQAWRIKRLADWLMALLSLVMLSPLLGLLAVIVRLDSPGPVLFRQWRVGAEGRLFRICKFRSMVTDAEARHHEVMGDQVGLHKLENDPRVTRIGRWLRKLSLDELPQLWNMLLGEMSLVGPRPWAIYDAVRIESELQGRLRALPGITGPWQVSTRANELDLYAVTCRDLAYLQHWQLWCDVKVLMLTVPKVLFGTGAC